MRIAICEDNEKDTRRLVQMIGVDHSCELYTSGEKLILDMEELSLRFDLYLLDIFLEDDENGIHLAGNIRSMDEEALICFVSTSDDFYRQAYDLYVFQYLIKPVEQQDMDRLLQRAEHQIKKNKGRAVIFERYGKPYAIPYQKLLYIASRGHNLLYKCKDGSEYSSGGKLNEIAEELDPGIFFRCHQSFIVNMYNVDDMQQNIFLCGGEEIPISRPYYQQAKERYRRALFEEFD